MIILASGSPRRKELLDQIGAEFVVQVSEAAEESGDALAPQELVKRNAIAKAEAVAREHPELPEIRLDSSGNIDNTQFAGYGTSFCGVWFGCSYEMWFGKAYDKYIPYALLTSFTDCKQHETLTNGNVHIVMYDAPDAFKSEESLRRAWRWRAHTDYISLAAEWQKRLNKT